MNLTKALDLRIAFMKGTLKKVVGLFYADRKSFLRRKSLLLQ